MNLVIFGAGAWGTALAVALSARHRVALWARDPVQASDLSGQRRNRRYLPDISLPASIGATADFRAALAGADLALIATPIAGLRDTLLQLKKAGAIPVVIASKGFEAHTATPAHRVVASELGPALPCAVLSGPSFALEVALGKPTALTLASSDSEFARHTAQLLHHPRLRIYYTTDIAGVEIGGAVKNVMAIATGISDGLGLGMNARAALITRGLAEMTRLGVKLGGRAETFMGLAGAGDLILTCTGDLSRNRRVGQMLAQGGKLDEVLNRLGHVAEGVHSAREVQRLAREAQVEMPISRAVCRVLFDDLPPAEAVEELLARDPRSETW